MSDQKNNMKGVTRRTVVGGLTASLVVPAWPVGASDRASMIRFLDDEGDVGERLWLGRAFWANRLQDWRREGTRLVCTKSEPDYELRTVGLPTITMRPVNGHTQISAVIGKIDDPASTGFGGFLVGVGAGRLDPRAAALANRSGGEGGGILAVIDSDGTLQLRDHTSESAPHDYAVLPSAVLTRGVAPPRWDRGVRLVVDVIAAGNTATVTLSAFEGAELYARIAHMNVPVANVTGGALLVSSSHMGQRGCRFCFSDVGIQGSGWDYHPELGLGPIAGALYMHDSGTLRLTAQAMPIVSQGAGNARLLLRASEKHAWTQVAEAAIGDGYAAIFEVTDWDASRHSYYRVQIDGTKGHFDGEIRPEPKHGQEVQIGLYGCVMASMREFDLGPWGGVMPPRPPQEQFVGRYTPECLVFPHNELIAGASALDPDIAVFTGDQFYEVNPTLAIGMEEAWADPELIKLDTLYKWYLWHWAFAPIVRNRPSVLLLDDHDYYQPNIWGQGGRKAPELDHRQGGFTRPPEFVRMIERVQCGHHPTPASAELLAQGIGRRYGSFVFGGIDFALCEDRKFKTGVIQGGDLDVHVGELLGAEQEQFLIDWASSRPDLPKVLLTQSLWASLQTSPSGKALIDFDSNGYPPLAARRAVEIAKLAGAIVLAGDQHLPSLVTMGDQNHGDGPIVFTGPAGGSRWQRWFEPSYELPNARAGLAHTGDFTDAFGHRLRIHAVANPKISWAELRTHVPGSDQSVIDRRLKSEGHGLVRIKRAESGSVGVTFECWPWNADCTGSDSQQFSGWPYQMQLPSRSAT